MDKVGAFLKKHKIKIIVILLIIIFIFITVDIIPPLDSYKDLDMSTPMDGYKRVRVQFEQLIKPIRNIIKMFKNLIRGFT